jgi:hypothetical protein
MGEPLLALVFHGRDAAKHPANAKILVEERPMNPNAAGPIQNFAFLPWHFTCTWAGSSFSFDQNENL